MTGFSVIYTLGIAFAHVLRKPCTALKGIKVKTFVVVFFSWLLIFGEALAIEPVGSIGKGSLRQLTFLPDGNMIRVMPKHIEIVDPDNDVVLANFAESSEFLGSVIVSPDGKQLVIRRRDTVELWDINGQEKLGEWEFESVRSWSGGVLDYPFLRCIR